MPPVLAAATAPTLMGSIGMGVAGGVASSATSAALAPPPPSPAQGISN